MVSSLQQLQQRMLRKQGAAIVGLNGIARVHSPCLAEIEVVNVGLLARVAANKMKYLQEAFQSTGIAPLDTRLCRPQNTL